MTSQTVLESKTCDKKYTVEEITVADAPEVISFLNKYFFKDEPINYYLKMNECTELEEWAVKCIPDGCSFKAVNTRGEMIGLYLNGILKKAPADAEHENAADTCNHPKFKQILALMDHIDTEFDLFQLYPDCEKALDGKILSVNPQYRGLGIAGELTCRTIDFMKTNDIPLFHVMCTSQFSARVCEKLGFYVAYQLPYLDYVVNGENPIVPAEPHTAIKVLVKKL